MAVVFSVTFAIYAQKILSDNVTLAPRISNESQFELIKLKVTREIEIHRILNCYFVLCI